MDLDIRGRALLAPISTFTNLPFRLLCQRHGAQGTTVPLLSAKAIVMQGIDMEELDPHPEERFVGVQLFGASDGEIGKAAVMVAKRFDFIKYIDINCACPVKKVVKTGAGSALLHRPAMATKMIAAAKECGLPITVKLRRLRDVEETLRFCHACEQAGAAAFFVHGRTREQGYSGEADWEIVKRIAESADVPVIGSGDIRGMEEGMEKARSSGCAGFMIGRAAMGDPGVFSSVPKATLERKRALFSEYHSLCKKFDCILFPDLKSKAIQLFTGFEDSAALRVKISMCKSEGELVAAIAAPQA